MQENNYKFRPFKGKFLQNLFYITHIDNIPSIIQNGILSHKQVENKNIKYTPIYAEEIVASRQEKAVPNDGRSLWHFANLYFQPRNPMLYRVLSGLTSNQVVVLALNKSILERNDIYITDGNAANNSTVFNNSEQGKKVIAKISSVFNKEYWTEESDNKRKIMAECLVPESISPDYIQTIYVADYETAQVVKNLTLPPEIAVVKQSDIFFKPNPIITISQNLSIVEGDMFFSRMQTLTVSVNCVGVMGKGLASRAKWQFPDVYPLYQYFCRHDILQLGQPYLYKRRKSLDNQLADEPGSLKNDNQETWFLLFATKQHWREQADINGIEKGLQWLENNYIKD